MTLRRPRGAQIDWRAVGRGIARAVAFARQHRSVVWVGTLAATFVAGYLLAALVLFPAPIFASSTVVPHLIGLDQEAALESTRQAGLVPGNPNGVMHPTTARGRVVWQDPPAGVAVPEGTEVAISVSMGPQRVPVPDLVGYDQRLADRLLSAAGLRVARVEQAQAPAPRGVVVNTRPPAGTALLPGSDVTLVVSLGAPTITVPNLIGLTQFEAELTLQETNLVLGTTLIRTSPADVPGTIIVQSPGPGTLAAAGTAVNVTIARERNP